VKQISQRVCYIRLHGSLDRRRGNDDVAVLAGAKDEVIEHFPILDMSFAVFPAALAAAARTSSSGTASPTSISTTSSPTPGESSGLRVSVIDRLRVTS
jgi:hypothetical protein